MRSLLCVEAAEAAVLDAALASGADALVLAFATADGQPVPPPLRHEALAWLAAVAQLESRPLLYLRVDAGHLDDETLDLVALLAGEPDGILLAGCRAGRDVQQLGAKLAVAEAEGDLPEGSVSILAEAGVSAQGLLDFATYPGCSDRLIALAWDAVALAADLGAETLRDTDGHLTGPLETARALTLLAARAAGVAAVDGAEGDVSPEVLQAACLAARRDGFNAKMTTRAGNVAIINAAFDGGS